ncbi:hypothetical protein [Helicobacter trogontum]|uniref:Uncharacterized protein n=1 Tax=Helicobacter trogontum TaxID=50960 RepID=A0A4U8S4F7_9HELI|nr:hypothetical protein [Helicobacter trogontum]TLD80651.1 hypothetical protein LS81_009395 [Helicobacter trogontum]
MQYDDLHYELHYIAKEQENIVSENFFNIRNQDKNFFVKPLDLETIHSLTKDSPIHLLRALYTCKPFAIYDEDKQSFITQENASKILGYKSNFANIFIYGKNSLSTTYLEARKALYKTYQPIKQEQAEELQKQQQELEQELQGLDSKQKRIHTTKKSE